MAGKKKNEPYEWDNFGSDNRATNAKERGLINITPPKKGTKKPVPANKKK